MKLKWRLGVGITAVSLAVGVVCWFTVDNFRFWTSFGVRAAELSIRPVPPLCKRRAADFQARVQRVRKDARNTLKIGATRDDVAHFFASESIPVDFVDLAGKREAMGTIFVKGMAECASVACGDDAALIGVRVDVDEKGTVLSEPVVVGMYTNCL